MSDHPFRANVNGTIRLQAATVAGAAPLLPTLAAGGESNVLIVNRGTVPVLVEFGPKSDMALPVAPSDIVAGAQSIPPNASTIQRLQRDQRHVAIAVLSGVPDIEFTIGQGGASVYGIGGGASGGGGGGGGSTGSVTAPGTSGTQAQAVQGIDGGVPQRTAPVDNWTPAGFPLTIATTGPMLSFVPPDGAAQMTLELLGTASLVVESSPDATTDTDGTWTSVTGLVNPDLSGVLTNPTLNTGARRKTYPLNLGRRYRINVTSFSAGAVVHARMRSTPFGERSVNIGGAVTLVSTSSVIGSTTLRTTSTNRSLTVGTTAAQAMAANGARQGWKVKNDSTGDIWINFDTTATAAPGGGNIKVPAGGYLASEPGFVETGAMSVIGSAAGLAITIREH